MDLGGARAVGAGGGRGIGRAPAVLLAKAGASVVIGYRRRRAEAEETVKALVQAGGRGLSVSGDLGDPGEAKRAVDVAAKALGGLDLGVVNHGIWPPDDVAVAQLTGTQVEAAR